jgi:hypothetical protein
MINLFSIPGGQNSQNLSESGIEAAIDTQLAYGLSYPIPSVYWSTRGTPPFIPDAKYPENGNEVREAISRVEASDWCPTATSPLVMCVTLKPHLFISGADVRSARLVGRRCAQHGKSSASNIHIICRP